jgi:hypothetical protein
MIPWSVLDVAKIPGDDGELRLKKRGTEFSIMLSNIEPMNSHVSASEETLAMAVCSRIQGRQRPQVIIGGLRYGLYAPRCTG